MSQLPADPNQSEGSGSNNFNEINGGSSDSAFHQNNSIPSEQQRLSPASEPNNLQERPTRRAGRQPKRIKEKKLSPNPQKLLSADNQISSSSSIPQIKLPDNDHAQMNHIPQCQFPMQMLSPVQVQSQIGISNPDNVPNSSNVVLQGVHPIRPVSTPQAGMMQPVIYQNNKIPINQMNMPFFAAVQNHLMNLDMESIELLFNMFELPVTNLSKQQYIEAFTTFVSSVIYTVPQNFIEFIYFLLQQFSNKANSILISQLTNPPIPIIFQQSNDKKIVYKFTPLNKQNIEVPPNNSIESEYAIIATIIPSSLQLNDSPIIMNGQQLHSSTFGEVSDRKYYLISPMSKGRRPNINFNVRLNQKIYQSFCWIVFYYVVPAPMTQIERFSGIDPPIKGVRTEKCQNSCLFNFYDVIHKIYAYGYSICPNCHQKIFLTRLIPIKLNRPQTGYIDSIASSFACHYDSNSVKYYDYFSKDIDVSRFICNKEDYEEKNDEDFDPDRYINEVEDYCLSVLKNDTF